MNTLRKPFLLLVSAALAGWLALGSVAWALSLDEARSAGLVGERPDGYIGVVQNAAGVEALVQSINAQRRAAYEETANRTGQPLSAVEAVSGQNLIARAQSGWYVQVNGQWVQK